MNSFNHHSYGHHQNEDTVHWSVECGNRSSSACQWELFLSLISEWQLCPWLHCQTWYAVLFAWPAMVEWFPRCTNWDSLWAELCKIHLLSWSGLTLSLSMNSFDIMCSLIWRPSSLNTSSWFLWLFLIAISYRGGLLTCLMLTRHFSFSHVSFSSLSYTPVRQGLPLVYD